MIYKNGNEFSLLTGALRAVGVKEEYIEILPQYLDTSQPRNDALLDSIQTEWYQGDYDTAQKFIKAVKHEIEACKDEELWKRWLLYTYQIAGSRCNQTGFVPYNYPEKLMRDVLRERYGDEAEARYFAITVTSSCESRYYCMNGLVLRSPEVCLQAMSFTKSFRAQLALIVFVLSQCKPPKKGIMGLFSKEDKTAAGALAVLKVLWADSMNRQKFPEYISLAVTLAAGFSDEWHDILLKNYSKDRKLIAEWVLGMDIDPEPAFLQLDQMTGQEVEYIELLSHTCATASDARVYYKRWILPKRDEHLLHMAKTAPDAYKQVMNGIRDILYLKRLRDVYQKANPDEQMPDLRESTRQRAIASLCVENESHEASITRYLLGTDSTEKFVSETLPNLRRAISQYRVPDVPYAPAFGMDDFAERCICFWCMINFKDTHTKMDVPGFEYYGHFKKFWAILDKHHVPTVCLVDFFGNNVPDWAETENLRLLASRADEVAAISPEQLSMLGREAAVRILHENRKDKALFAYAGDVSKSVRSRVISNLPKPGGEFDDEYRKLLTSKKMTIRDTAVSVFENHGLPDSLRADVQAAYDKEKNEKLKARFAVLLGEAAPVPEEKVVGDNIVQELTKGSRVKKVDFLFTQPFAPVRMKEEGEADERTLKALCVSYAEECGRSRSADTIAATLNTSDLETFAQDCFRRWAELGSPAKTKWVLYLTAIHGGMEAVAGLQRYIKEWSENSRGAIAAEATNALALNGTSVALMAVDAMARKFKNKQVRSAAGKALQSAADGLGITREELADRIVPDLGFDENRCRVFDFGTRQFRVYINPSLEMEIYEGEKQLKNLPKPGTKDDPEKSEQAVKDFKEMKKQMKTAVQTQQARLEYVMLCDRKWTAEGWRALFVRKAVMHSFAIGLIWGVYEGGKLVQSFRFMEDGSFNTADEDEYELPENAVIGLVHPMELSDELRQQWTEQLSDYEIKQPFPQLTRPVYYVTDEEKTETALMRFEGHEITAISLLGKMTKLGWDKGYPGDGGILTEFVRSDIMKQSRNEDGSIVREGFHAELTFSGMDIGGYDNMDDVTVEKVEFYNINGGKPLPLGSIPPRYFSEIIYQLSNNI